MKINRITLLVCLISLLAVSCKKDESSMMYTTGRFLLQMEPFSDGNDAKTYLQYGADASRIVYEEGDEVMVNGRPFTITRDGSQWFAVGSEITATKFYAAYVDGTCDEWNESAGTYGFNINPYMDDNTHNKVILAGTSDNGTVLTLKPACAIIRVNTGAAGSDWTNVKVGFSSNKILKRGTVTPDSRGLTAGVYMDACSQGHKGDMLAMRWSKQGAAGQHVTDEDGYWYVAVPIAGDNISTQLFFMWNDGSGDIYKQTQGQVTLQKGYVYTLGTERQSPFTDKGYSKYYIYVNGSNDRVAFTAGNLQCQMYVNEDLDDDFKWQFATTQTVGVGTAGNAAIGATEQWFDLFGYGTSNWSGSGATAWMPSSISTTNSHYYSGSLNGTNADWGVNNRTTPGIYYGNSLVSFNKFRTLTNTEWSYVINRTNGGQKLAGLVHIDGRYFGLMLLPNTGLNGAGTWSNTTDVNISSLSLTSVLSLSSTDWGKLEAIGAIFLPALGQREGTSVGGENSMGYYWTATTSTTSKGYMMYFNSSSVATAADSKKYGCAVRLVAQVGSYTPVL